MKTMPKPYPFEEAELEACEEDEENGDIAFFMLYHHQPEIPIGVKVTYLLRKIARLENKVKDLESAQKQRTYGFL